MELSKLGGVREVLCKLLSSLPTFKLEEPKPTGRCMYGILFVKFTKVGEIHVFLVDY